MAGRVDLQNTDQHEKTAARNDDTITKQLTMIGRGECGKTSIMHRLIRGQFITEIPATPIESECIEYLVNKTKITLKIFDTSGQNDYSRFRALTLPVSDYILVCYSVVDPISFSEVEDTLFSMIEQKAPAHAKVILCATKIDKRTELDKTTEEGRLLAKRINAIAFFECSSLANEGVSEIFDFIKSDAYASKNVPQPGFFARFFSCCAG